MSHKNDRKELHDKALASLGKEMAKARMTRSARIAELNLDTTRTVEPPATTLPGTVDKIMPPRPPKETEKAQISVDGPDRLYRNLRIENKLTDEHGDDVSLKKGAHVEVTITSEPKK